jgi:hypothetical protein
MNIKRRKGETKEDYELRQFWVRLETETTRQLNREFKELNEFYDCEDEKELEKDLNQ